MRLSDQALGAIMMALQNSLLHQTDIVPVLKNFNLQLNNKEELNVLNPPVVNMTSDNNEKAFEDESISTTGSD